MHEKISQRGGTCDQLSLFVSKGRKAKIQAAADAAGESLNDFIVTAINRRMLRLGYDKPFTRSPGVWCYQSCPERGEIVRGSDRRPWCFAYAIEITEQSTDGVYHKCTECLRNTPEK